MKPYLTPIAIVLAGAFVGGGLYLSNSPAPTAQPNTEVATAPAPEAEGSLEQLRPVDETDHIKGNPDAAVKIVEYSDFECPFCKRFHDTMNEIMDTYGDTGEVAWVYRHFPLDQLHPVKARAEAVASECAAELGGNDAFWQFADRFMELTPSNNQTDIEIVIPQIAQEIGLDQTAFQTCFESGRHDERIDADIENAIATGGRGTPWSIVVGPDGQKYPLNGAQPKEAILQLIELARQEQ